MDHPAPRFELVDSCDAGSFVACVVQKLHPRPIARPALWGRAPDRTGVDFLPSYRSLEGAKYDAFKINALWGGVGHSCDLPPGHSYDLGLSEICADMDEF